MQISLQRFDRPLLFYALATGIPWSCWFAAGWISHLPGQDSRLVLAASLLGLVGLLAPFGIGVALMWRKPELRRDLVDRLVNVGQPRPVFWLVAGGLMPLSILAAMGLSIPLGYSPAQFQLATHASFSSGVFPVWFLLIAAPVIEELGWHTYGTDCLRSRFSLITASLIFASYWAVWHAPLAGIRDYYQSNLTHQGLLAALNFPISIIPFVVIMNWIYYRSGRNILITALFHVTAGLFNEAFQTHPDSKVIQTGLLIVVAAVIVARERALFFTREAAGAVGGAPRLSPSH